MLESKDREHDNVESGLYNNSGEVVRESLRLLKEDDEIRLKSRAPARGELCGLRWSDVDLDAGTIRLVHQLLKPGKVPVFGPLKAGRPQTITLSAETVKLLAVHKRQQAELKLRSRQHYTDHGLVFAKEYSDLTRHGEMLGCPLQMNNVGEHQFAKLVSRQA